MRMLVVEDSPVLGAIITKRLTKGLDVALQWVTSFAEARVQVEQAAEPFDYVLVDLNLPDASGMEVVDFFIGSGIPPIVFTGDCSNSTRELIWSRKIVDYIIKDSGHSIGYLVYLLRRLEANRGVKLLLVDDSMLFRRHLGGQLRSQNFEVIEVESGQSALDTLERVEGIRLVLTDYHMEGMNGFELTMAIRKRYPEEQLSIVGMSFHGDHVLSAQFLKSGASDFIDKSFTAEQLFCRINKELDTLDLIGRLREAAIHDHLTGLFNRRHFFEAGETLLLGARRRKAPAMVAMLDIDHFKRINDTHGHSAGDAVIRGVADALQARFRKSDIVTRFGGEEFCVLATDADPAHMGQVLDLVRGQICAEPFTVDGVAIPVSVSAGMATGSDLSLQEMVNLADVRLYQAKQSGRNRVVSG